MADQVKNAEPEVLRASRRNVKRALVSTKSAGMISYQNDRKYSTADSRKAGKS
jgi:hypothetical protein